MSASLNAPSGAQCLPTKRRTHAQNALAGLNAPSGAQCFPTRIVVLGWFGCRRVSMHLLVLSAFRPLRHTPRRPNPLLSQCTFWCSVLSDQTPSLIQRSDASLNAPSGAQCFPTQETDVMAADARRRGLNAPSGAQCFPTLTWLERLPLVGVGLNAPSGAQCFPTGEPEDLCDNNFQGLNAPSGAQCFPTRRSRCADCGPLRPVSMRLLALSTFRR